MTEKDRTVTTQDQTALTEMALDQLLLAYAKGERAGHVEWEDLDNALECAKAARPGRFEAILETLNAEEKPE